MADPMDLRDEDRAAKHVELCCSLADVDRFGNLTYVVHDAAGALVAMGVSSNRDWVEHDAGGYHTKRNFDARYGEGQWRVVFIWDRPA